MTVIYGLTGVIISSIFILSCYGGATGEQFSKTQKILFSVLYLILLYATAIITPSFLIPKVVIGFTIGIIFLLLRKSIDLIILIWSVLIAQVIWLIAVILVASILLELFGTDFTSIVYILSMALEIGIYILILRSKLLKQITLVVNESELKKIALMLGMFLLLIIMFLRFLFDRLQHLFDITLLFVLLASIVLIIVIFVMCLDNAVKKYFEKQTDREIILSNQKLIFDVQQELSDSLAHFAELKTQMNKRPIDPTHQFNQQVQVINEDFRVLQRSLAMMEEIGILEDAIELKELAMRLENSLGDLGSELHQEEVEQIINELRLPSDWQKLESLLTSYSRKAKEEGINLYLFNTSTLWQELQISEKWFIQLLGNLISNGIKELLKSKDSSKIITINFFDKDGSFVISIQDNAHEFPIHILQRLGQRGNSTNGTGDGYPEMFAILQSHGGSLHIEEMVYDEKMMKMVEVIFDGLSQRSIKSNYRMDLLRFELLESVFEVEI